MGFSQIYAFCENIWLVIVNGILANSISITFARTFDISPV